MLFMLAWLLWLHNQQRKKNDLDVDYPIVCGVGTGTVPVNNTDVVVSENVKLSESAQLSLSDLLKDTLERAVSDTSTECLFISDEHIHTKQASCNNRLKIVDEDILTVTDVLQDQQSFSFDFDDLSIQSSDDNLKHTKNSRLENWNDVDFSDVILQNDERQIRQANLSYQTSFKKLKAEDLNVSSNSDDFIESDVLNENTTVKQAKILSQQSFKKDRGDVKRFQRLPESISPVKTENDIIVTKSAIESHAVSDIKLMVDGKSTTTRKHVSCVENNIGTAPVKLLLNSNTTKDASLEDDEIQPPFESGNFVNLFREDEDMQYTTENGTRVNVKKTNQAGRIHSIVVGRQNTPAKIQCNPSDAKVRVSSTSSPVHVTQNLENVPSSDEDLGHLVANKHKMDDFTNSAQMDVSACSIQMDVAIDLMQVPEQETILSPVETSPQSNVQIDSMLLSTEIPSSPLKTPPPTKSKPKRKPVVEEVSPVLNETVQHANPEFNFDGSSKKNQDVNKLNQRKSPKKVPREIEQRSAESTDFDAIMKRRKKYIDTMDDAGRLLGQIAHRDEKIYGGPRTLSKHWKRVKEAVRTKNYLRFKDRPMKKSIFQ